MNRRHMTFVANLFTQLFLFIAVISDADADSLTIPNRQPWSHITGPCTGLDGAIFAVVGTGCGGTGTSFDTAEIFSPVVIKDVATVDAPCTAISVPTGNTCYRLWYVGTTTQFGTPRIGYALSTDGLNWTRVPGAGFGGSVLDESVGDTFDNAGASYQTVMKDGTTFKMWYTGLYDDPNSTGPVVIAGIGYATSTDGMTWVRHSGTLPGLPAGRVYEESGLVGDFDEHEAYVPNVIKDIATVDVPCDTITTGTCYRMWYEGVNTSNGYLFRLGYATSPDGLTWTRIPGSSAANSNFSGGSGFDANAVAIAIVIKDGDRYRMWYEAKDFEDPANYAIGYVVSPSGEGWVRPIPNDPVYDGADDPATNTPDNVWSHWVIKDGARYKMWYTTSTRADPEANRFAYASMVPGDPMVISRNAAAAPTYTLSFTTTEIIPADGYILITLPPEINFAGVTAGALGGFQPGATLVADEDALTDAAAANVARGALLIRLDVDEPAGVKTATFTLPTPVTDETIVVVQTFDVREVLEYGLVDLLSGTTAIQLSQLGTTPHPRTFLAVLLTGLGLFTLLYLRWYQRRVHP